MKQGSSMEVAKVTKRRYQSVHCYYASMLCRQYIVVCYFCVLLKEISLLSVRYQNYLKQ